MTHILIDRFAAALDCRSRAMSYRMLGRADFERSADLLARDEMAVQLAQFCVHLATEELGAALDDLSGSRED